MWKAGKSGRNPAAKFYENAGLANRREPLVPVAAAAASARSRMGDEQFPVWADAQMKAIKTRRARAKSEKKAGY